MTREVFSGDHKDGVSQLVFQHVIYKRDLRLHRSTVFVFGDNAQRQGFGGQAREMRGEPNALGIATKWNPGRESGDYFTDDDPRCAIMIMRDLGKLFASIGQQRVVLPADGIGTGLAELPERAPRCYALIYDAINAVVIASKGPRIPWPVPRIPDDEAPFSESLG